MTVSIYDYLDYRVFLKDCLRARKAAGNTLSLGALSQRVPGASKPLLSLILNGKRNLSASKIEPLGKALALSNDRHRYFRSLVHFTQARTTAEKAFFLDQLVSLRPATPACQFKLEQYRALRNWHCMVVRELVKLPGFDPSPVAISRRLCGRLKPTEAKQALDTLLSTGMVESTADGCFSVEERTLRSTDDTASFALRAYHRSCLELGKQVLEEVELSQREYASVNIVLTAEQFAWVKSQIKKFRGDVAALPNDRKSPRRIYQMNIQFFPVGE